MQLYFTNDVYNIILIFSLMLVLVIANHLLNLCLNLNDRKDSSLNLSGSQMIKVFANDNEIERIEGVSSPNLPEFDAYAVENGIVYLNSRCFNGKGISSIFQTILLLSFYNLHKKNPKMYKFYYITEPIVVSFATLSWAIAFIGLLLHLNGIILAGIIILLICYGFIFFTIPSVLDKLIYTREYLATKLNDDELKIINKMIRFEKVKYFLKPFLSFSKLFIFLLPKNQRKPSFKERTKK